jgi:hypothetical protein
MSVTFSADVKEEINEDSKFELHGTKVLSDPKDEIYNLISSRFSGSMRHYAFDQELELSIGEWINLFGLFGNVSDVTKKYSGSRKYPIYSAINSLGGEILFYLGCEMVNDSDNTKYIEIANDNALLLLMLLGLHEMDYMSLSFLGMGNDLFDSKIDRTPEISGTVTPYRLMSAIEDKGEIDKRSDLIRRYKDFDEDYVRMKLLELEELADYCFREECNIVWG